jgi:hypothetical protein
MYYIKILFLLDNKLSYVYFNELNYYYCLYNMGLKNKIDYIKYLYNLYKYTGFENIQIIDENYNPKNTNKSIIYYFIYNEFDNIYKIENIDYNNENKNDFINDINKLYHNIPNYINELLKEYNLYKNNLHKEKDNNEEIVIEDEDYEEIVIEDEENEGDEDEEYNCEKYITNEYPEVIDLYNKFTDNVYITKLLSTINEYIKIISFVIKSTKENKDKEDYYNKIYADLLIEKYKYENESIFDVNLDYRINEISEKEKRLNENYTKFIYSLKTDNGYLEIENVYVDDGHDFYSSHSHNIKYTDDFYTNDNHETLKYIFCEVIDKIFNTNYQCFDYID